MNHTYINLDVTSILLFVKVNTDMLKQMVNKDIKRISKYNKENIHSQVEHYQNKPTYCITTKIKKKYSGTKKGGVIRHHKMSGSVLSTQDSKVRKIIL